MNITVFVTAVVALTSLSVLVGLWRPRQRSFTDYASNPNQHGWFAIGMSVAGTVVGGGMFLGISQIGYEAGVLGFILGFTYLLGLGLLGTTARSMRRSLESASHRTLIEILGETYGATFVGLFAFVNLLMYLFLFAGQILAVISFCVFLRPYIGLGSLLILLVPVAAGMLLYPVIGGLRKDIVTDVVQMCVVIAGTTWFVMRAVMSGALTQGLQGMGPAALTGTAYGVPFVVGSILFLTPSFVVRTDMWQRIGAARTDADARLGFWLGAILSAGGYFAFTVLGIAARGGGVESSRLAAPALMLQQFVDPIPLALVVAAFFSAVLSTADTLLNSVSLFAARLMFGGLWSQERGDRQLLNRSRILGLVGAGVAGFLAWTAADFVDLLIGAMSLLLVFGAPAIGLFVEELRHRIGAVASSTVGVLSFVILFFSWNPKLAFAPAVLLSFAVYFGSIFISRMKAGMQAKI